jgi:hypothetical protein
MGKRLLFVPVLLFLFAFSCENEDLSEDIVVEDPPVVTDPDNTDPGDTDPGDTDPGDTDPGNTDPASLVGTWQLESLSFDFTTSTDFNGQMIESNFIGALTQSDFTLTLTESTYTGMGSYSYDISGTANGMEIPSSNYTLTDVSTSGNYSVDGNVLTTDGQLFEFDFGGQVEAGSFDGPQSSEFELSADGNTLTFNQDETSVDNENGVEVTSTTISTSVFQRVD